jgi:hypothetical protein
MRKSGKQGGQGRGRAPAGNHQTGHVRDEMVRNTGIRRGSTAVRQREKASGAGEQTHAGAGEAVLKHG